MVAAEAAAAGSLPLVANHSGLAEIAAGIAAEYPDAARDLTSFASGDAVDLAAKLRRLLALTPGERAELAEAARRAVVKHWSWQGVSQRLPEALRVTSRRGRGEAPNRRRAGPPRARAVRVGRGFHRRRRGGVRDPRPENLSLTNRFEELKASALGTELEEHLVGELIASEVEIRTGRCDTFAEVAARIPERRAQLYALAEKLGVTLGAAVAPIP